MSPQKRSRPSGAAGATTKRGNAGFNGNPCPDCAANPDPARPGVVPHDPTCPLFRNLEAAMLADVKWFNKHPGRHERRRPATPAERIESRLSVGYVPDEMLVSRPKHGCIAYGPMNPATGQIGQIVVMPLQWGGGAR